MKEALLKFYNFIITALGMIFAAIAITAVIIYSPLLIKSGCQEDPPPIDLSEHDEEMIRDYSEDGIIHFIVVDTMTVDNTYDVLLDVKEDFNHVIDSSIASILGKKYLVYQLGFFPDMDTNEIKSKVNVSISDTGNFFKFFPSVSDSEHVVNEDNYSMWKWVVVPIKEGNIKLIATISTPVYDRIMMKYKKYHIKLRKKIFVKSNIHE